MVRQQLIKPVPPPSSPRPTTVRSSPPRSSLGGFSLEKAIEVHRDEP